MGSAVELTLKSGFNQEHANVPLETDFISPDVFVDKTNDQIKRLEIFHGNKESTLGEFFDVKGEKSDHIVIHGDCYQVKKIGQYMSQGLIEIQGNAGYHTGAHMRGGKLIVHGNTRDWAGAHMKNGLLWIKGNTGHFIGSAYKGDLIGMTGGTILVEGNVRNECGTYMRRGLLVVGGKAGDFTGLFMTAGTILLLGGAGIRTGANMKRGTVISTQPIDVLPTFFYSCSYQPDYTKILFNQLRAIGFDKGLPANGCTFKRYSGDMLNSGKGEILIAQ